MCGIAGFSGSYDPELLRAMADRIAHRGPDDQDVLLLESATARVGLAHRRLSIIDLSSNAHEPMGVACERCGIHSKRDPARGRWLVYNGEIYNYRELRA
ncbi:MAG TPA: asparagine synthetase B, partial [Thermoanaerobaculia bacterium]|nr:asparagine synthetase B [Thermoanaerobaculia bacterium]